MIRDLGSPVREGALLGDSYVIGPDQNGKMNTIYISIAQYEESVLFVTFNIDTNETKQYRAVNSQDISAKQGAWGIARLGNNVYLGTYYNGHLLRYDIKKDELLDLGQAIKGEEYIWSLASDGERYVYGGTYPGGKLFVIDIKTDTVTDLGKFDDESLYCRFVKVRNDGKVIVSLGTKQVKVGVYDPLTNTKKVILFPEALTGLLMMHQDDQGNVFVQLPKSEDSYQVVEDELKKLGGRIQTRMNHLTGGRKMVAINNQTVTIENEQGDQKTHQLNYTSSGLMLWMVHKGPDDLIYGSSALPLRMFRHDPQTGMNINMGNPTPSAEGEIYSMTNLDGKIYVASYPGCYLAVYDPEKPWNAGLQQGNNPREIGAVGHKQNRPISMVSGPDGNIYIASVPDYGETSGALSRFDPKTEQFTVWRGIVEEHSVYTLEPVPDTRCICAATSNEIGTGADVPTGDARLFIWDIDKEKKIKEIYPVPGAKRIVSIKFKDGLIYGLTGNGVLFAYDYQKQDIIWSRDLEIQNAIWPGMDITDKNIIYGAGDDKLFRYDISKGEYKVVAETKGWVLGFYMDKDEQKIYYTPSTRLYCYDIRD